MRTHRSYNRAHEFADLHTRWETFAIHRAEKGKSLHTIALLGISCFGTRPVRGII